MTNKRSVNLLEIERRVDMMGSTLDKLVDRWVGFNKEYLIGNYDIVLDLLKNLLTVTGAITAGAFALSVSNNIVYIFLILIFVIIVLITIVLMLRVKHTNKLQKFLGENLLKKIDRIEKEADKIRVQLKNQPNNQKK